MEDLAFKQPGDGLQPDVRMRGNVHGFGVGEAEGREAVEEAPGADHAAIADGEHAFDGEVAELDGVAGVGNDRLQASSMALCW